MGIGLLVAAALAAATAVVVLRFLPAREPAAERAEGTEPSMPTLTDRGTRVPATCSRRTERST